MATLLNFVGFQLVWFASVWGAAKGWWWLGPLAALLFATLHFGAKFAKPGDVRLVGLALLFGVLIDSAFAAFGVLRYASPIPFVQAAPVWILSMWVGFALTLKHSLGWLQGKLALQGLFGAIGGPLAYVIAGRAWGAVSFGVELPIVIALLALAWGIVTPLLLHLAKDVRSQVPA
jgi:hypothetical protein